MGFPAETRREPRLGQPATAAELAGAALFREVSFESVLCRVRDCSVLELERGTPLITPNAGDRDIFVVLAGRLTVHLDAPEEPAVYAVERGETVGELAMLDAKPRSAFVVAARRSRVLRIAPDLFWSLLATSHEIALNMLGELATRVRKNNGVITETRNLALLYRRHASIDPLTGLHNRRWLSEMLPRLVRRCRMQSEPLSALMIDIDHFKRFNDEFGHAAGDFVLFAVAQVLKERLRPTDLVARYGGEELTALLPRTDLAGACAAAERVRRAIAETRLEMPSGLTLPSVTVSIGAAQAGVGQDGGGLLASADEGLYAAKRGGRNRVVAATG